MAFDVDKIEEKIDRAVAADIEIAGDSTGISIKRLVDAMEVAKVISISKMAIPEFMRGEPGICYAAVVRSVRWGLDPFFVAENMFLAKTKGGDKIGFQAQLINSVINLATPRILEGKLRCRYEGEGEELKCIVFGTPKGEKEPLEYETPTVGAIIKHLGRNEYGKVRGSPLYELDPKQQLFYYGSKGFTRKWFPEVLGGVYDREDMEMMRDVTPQPTGGGEVTTSLVQRLQDKRQRHTQKATRGFDHEHVNRTVDEATGVIEGSASRVAETEEKTDGGKEEGHDATGDGGAGVQDGGRNTDTEHRGVADDTSAGAGADGEGGDAEGGVAGGASAAQAEVGDGDDGQADIFPADRKPSGKRKR